MTHEHHHSPAADAQAEPTTHTGPLADGMARCLACGCHTEHDVPPACGH